MSARPVPELSDGVVRLRRHTEADLPGIVAQANDPESIRWTTVPVPYAEADARAWALQTSPAGWADGSAYCFAIEELATGAFCGSVDVRPQDPGAAEVGYGLGPAARGRGLMARALRLVVDWSFADRANGGLGLHVLRWQAHVGNLDSRRVVWRLGFRVEGTVRRQCLQRGDLHDAWVGTLLREDPREPASSWLDAPTVHGNGVVLRPWRATDAPALVEACNDPESRRWLAGLPVPYTLEDAHAFVDSREYDHAAGVALHVAAALDTDGPAVGSFSVMGLGRQRRDTGEVGYWVHPGLRGRRVGTRAVRLLVRHAFVPVEAGGLGLRRLVLSAAVGNLASQRVAERAGFRRTGTDRQVERLGDGTLTDLASYDLLADDPLPAPA